MSGRPSVLDLPACPKCNQRRWVYADTNYACNATGCDYRTSRELAAKGILAPPSKPIGHEDVDPKALEANPNVEDHDGSGEVQPLLTDQGAAGDAPSD